MFLLALPALAGPSTAVVFDFEPHFVDVTANDDTLEAYGYAPVRSPFVPQFGVRGVFEEDSGVRFGMTASFGFISARADHTPVPTTTNWTKIGLVGGYRLHRLLAVGADVGFGALTHSVGSEQGGGALLYLGPFAQPRADVVLLDSPSWLSVGVGWMLHVPVGPAHSQPLWEADFHNRLIHGPTLSVQTGRGTKG